MKQVTLFWILLIPLSIFGQIKDISFNTNNWEYTSDVTFEGASGVVTMTEQSSYYYSTAKLPVSLTQVPEDLYFSAEIYTDGYDAGDASWDLFKLKLYDGNNNKLTAYNIGTNDVPAKTWTRVLLSYKNFKNLNISNIILEVGMQNAKGTIKIRNPQLTSVAPSLTPYSFPWPVPTDPSCNISITTGDTTTFNSDLLSTNAHFSWSNASWGDTALQATVQKELPMTNMRFPGGTVGNFYNWENDQYYSDSATFESASRKNLSENGWKFGFDGYAELCKKLNASSTLMFNVFNNDVESSKNRLKNRIDAGLDVKWIELGNENYYGTQSYGYISPSYGVSDVTKYISFTKTLATGLREIKPDIKIAVNIDCNDYSNSSWSHTLAQENYYDATVTHHYFNPGYSDLNLISGKYLLSVYKKLKNELSEYEKEFPSVPTIATEYGILETPDSFLRVMGYAELMMAFIEEWQKGVVMQAGMHMLNHGGGYNNSQWIYKDDTTGKVYLTTAGILYSTMFKYFSGNAIYNSQSTSAELETNLPAINAKAFNTNDSIIFFVINKLPVESPLNITIDGSKYNGPFSLKYLHKDISIEMTEPTTPYTSGNNAWVKENGTGVISIPAYSIALVSVQKDYMTSVNKTNHKNNQQALNLYPNPSKGIIKLSSKTSFAVYSISGTCVKQGKGAIIDLSKEENGVYFVKTPSKIYTITKIK